MPVRTMRSQDGSTPFTSISGHAIIGDLRTAALVAASGAVDWLCVPRFDSPSVFSGLLDAEGGSWLIAPAGKGWTARQFYLPDTNVLVTRFAGNGGVVEVTDLMPVLRPHDPDHRQRLVRSVRAVRGSVPLEVVIDPRFDYGRAERRSRTTPGGVRFDSAELALTVTTASALRLDDRGAVRGVLTLQAGETADFVLDVLQAGEPEPEVPEPAGLVQATTRYWNTWVARCTYRGRWRERVTRSALVLKLLTHEPTGAIIASPTTSLPESIGGDRNWDYRHVWVRDAAFSMYALLRLGFLEEAGAFIGWLLDRVDATADGTDGPLRSMYDIDGGSTAGEFTLDHWSGYRDSAPVRVRNDAAAQLQLDVYGELIDSVYLYDKYGTGISYDSWQRLTGLLDWLGENWQRSDEGIWETRGGRRPHTFSRMMCWVAFERMTRMSRRRGLPGDIESWGASRDAIMRQVFERSWDGEQRAFTQFEGSSILDASVLLMPMVKFVSPADERFVSTVRAIEQRLVTDTLVFRYDTEEVEDGVGGAEGTFSMCSFWYVEALTRTGRTEEARLALEKMFTYANAVGLYAEEIDVDGEQVGNFPQAFTHLSLISAAVNLDRALR